MNNDSNTISRNYVTNYSDSLIFTNMGPAQYRFSGYQLPKISLDESGPSYYVVAPHPYFSNQPEMWTKPAYQNGHVIGDNPAVIAAQVNNGNPINPNDFKPKPFTDQIPNPVNPFSKTNQTNQEITANLFRMSNF